jgi:hypothetical protein
MCPNPKDTRTLDRAKPFWTVSVAIAEVLGVKLNLKRRKRSLADPPERAWNRIMTIAAILLKLRTDLVAFWTPEKHIPDPVL